MTTKVLPLLLVLLCVGFYQSAAAQDVLVLAGRATEIKLIEENARSVTFQIDLQLTLRNSSQSPVILYWHEFLVDGEALFTKTDKGAAELLQQTSSLSSTDLSPEWSELRQKLNVPTPPSGLTRVLSSEQWIETKRTVVVRFFKNKLDRATWDEIRRRSPLFLRVTLDMFPNNLTYPRNPRNAFGKSLQIKWRRFGKLQIEPIQSEPILIELPDRQTASCKNQSQCLSP